MKATLRSVRFTRKVVCGNRSSAVFAAIGLAANGLPAAAQTRPAPTETYPFHIEGGGPFAVTPVSNTVVRDDQVMSFVSALPFQLTEGFVRGFDDLTIATFPDRFFGGTFAWFGKGEDALFGTVTVQTSVFSDPINPQGGDFVGSEDFTGTFQIIDGRGRYLNATGGGIYFAHSEWRPPLSLGTFFSGFTSVIADGTVTIIPHVGQSNAPRALTE